MIRLRVRRDNPIVHQHPLYIGEYLGAFSHTGIERSYTFKSYEDAKFVVINWVTRCFPLTGMELYEVEEVT